MENISLKKELPAVFDGQQLYRGGSQQLLPRKAMRDVGCGIVGAANVLLYLSRKIGKSFGPLDGKEETLPLSLDRFRRACRYLQLRYLPILPGFGMNGITLSIGMNRFFLTHRIPYRAHWCVSAEKLPEHVSDMLEKDLPVILAIGPNFPFFWRKKRLSLYRRLTDGRLTKAGSTTGHYVTITAMDDECFTVSSWGHEYIILREEYRNYSQKSSVPLFSNILLLREVPRRRKHQSISD